jgi:hypothetical protein|tara:strand:+ start:1139 stop:1528 length:390 start_codon:yes stop_codon:yes gene_type:complete
MKKSELKLSIKETIIEILSEVGGDESKVSSDDVENQKAYNAELEKTAKLSKDAGLTEEEMDDDAMDKKASKAAKKGGSMSKIAYKLADTQKEMKSVVKKWKTSEGAEKERLTSRLKELTKIKKELEGLI